MYKSIALISALSLIFLFSCNSTPSQQETADTTAVEDTLRYGLKTLRYESDLPVQSPDSANQKTYFQAVFPRFQDSSLNAYVQKISTFSNNPDIEYQSLEEVGKGFIQEFEEYQELDYSSPWAWYKNIEVKVEENRPSYLGLAVHYDDFMGGAHGNHGITFGNYNLSQNKEIELSDLIPANQLDSLRSIAEEIFIAQENVSDRDFSNYFFQDDQFALNNNFLLKENHIHFLYNIYEIKSYAEGTTALDIPYSKIVHLMTPEARELLNLQE